MFKFYCRFGECSHAVQSVGHKHMYSIQTKRKIEKERAREQESKCLFMETADTRKKNDF